MAIHELKTWPIFWDAIAQGDKRFELRYNDRGYQAGDTLHLRRWSKDRSCYVEPYGPIIATVGYVLGGELFGLRENWVCMSLVGVNVPKDALRDGVA